MCADSYCYYISILKVNFFSLQAEADAYKIMGRKKFYHQIKEDERLFQKFKITDDIDIVTLKDYMQVGWSTACGMGKEEREEKTIKMK